MSRDAESEDSLVGEVLAGRYVVEACIGEGAMGAVYRARHAEVGRLFAIKILHPRFRGDERTNRRFMREAKLAGTLHHPNVVSVIDVGELADGRRYLVMDHADGPTLLDLINESSPMPTARVIKLVKQLCAGLHHAHEHGLIHRDFKPDNVIVERDRRGDETPRIVDFGIAILRDDLAASDTDRLTTGGLVLGTPHYMSPEHATGAPIDHRIDLFALGVTCFEMIAGVSPYEGDGVDVARANLLLDTPVMAARVPGLVVDPLLEAFTRKLMMKSRDDRPPTAGAARDLLELMERDRNAAAAALGIDLRDPAPWAPARRGARAPAPPPMMHVGAMPAPATIPAHAAHAVMSPHAPHTAMPAHVSLPHTMPALGDPPPWPTPQGSSPPSMNAMNGMAPSATPSIIVEQELPPPSAPAYPPTWPSPLPWPGSPAHHTNHPGPANHTHHAWPAGTASEATEQILPMRPRRASYALPIIAAVASTAVIVAMAISLNRRDARSNAAAAAARRAEPHVMAPPVAPAPAPVAMTATPPTAVAPPPTAPPDPAPVAPAASAPTPAAISPTPAATAPPPAPAPVAVAHAPAAPAHPAPRAETARSAPPAKPEPAVEPAPAPVAPPAKLTAARVAELYATVGRELKALDQSQGPSSTSELWPTYLQIRINDVITDPRKLEPTNAMLLKLSSQISRRR